MSSFVETPPQPPVVFAATDLVFVIGVFWRSEETGIVNLERVVGPFQSEEAAHEWVYHHHLADPSGHSFAEIRALASPNE